MQHADFARLRKLKAWLVPLVFAFCVFSVVLGIPGVCKLFSPEYRGYLRQDLVVGGVGSASAVQTYLVLQCLLTAACPVFGAVMAVCLGITLFGRSASGIGKLSTAAEWMVRGLYAAGVLLCCQFAWRFLSYTVMCLRFNGGVYQLYAMLISEALMVVLVAVAFFNLRKFLNHLCDSAASIAYTLAAGKLDTTSISGFTATGFLLLAVVCLVIAGDQMFTLTIAYDALAPYYKLLTATQPARWAVAAGFLCAAVADMLLFFGLRRYKQLCERILFDRNSRLKS